MYWIQATNPEDNLKYRYEYLTAEQVMFFRNHYVLSGYKVETGKKMQ